MKKILNLLIVLFLLSSKIFSYDIQDFSDSEWFDNISVESMIIYQKPILDKYDIVRFGFPEKNNSSDYKDWGYYYISGIGGLGAIYSVSKITDDKFTFEYGYLPSSAYPDDKPEKLSEPNICTVYIENENKLVLVNPPLNNKRVTLYRKTISNDSTIKLQDGIVNDLNVRIRFEPNTKGLVLGKLQTGTNIKIIKKTEPYLADGKYNCWYQIQVEGYPICWIFGEYVSMKDEYLRNFGVIE